MGTWRLAGHVSRPAPTEAAPRLTHDRRPSGRPPPASRAHARSAAPPPGRRRSHGCVGAGARYEAAGAWLQPTGARRARAAAIGARAKPPSSDRNHPGATGATRRTRISGRAVLLSESCVREINFSRPHRPRRYLLNFRRLKSMYFLQHHTRN